MENMTDEVIGVFIGLQSSSYEYIANIVAPYKLDFSIELGNFLLIDDSPNKLLARVIDFVPQGELTSFMGLKWLSDVAFNSDAIGSDLKKRKISYSVKIKILGSLDSSDKYSPGLRKIPHITSRVIKASPDVIKKVLNQALEEQEGGDEIGTYYLDSSIKIRFKISELDSKRTFVFARAGYGKSNLMKVIASSWKKEFGGLVVFDPEGEYAMTDDKSRPGMMDNREAIYVTTRQDIPTTKNVYPKLKINLKSLSHKMILPMVIPPEKFDNIFFQKLMGLRPQNWNNLVDLMFQHGWEITPEQIKQATNLTQERDEDLRPIRNNLIGPIQNLHDPSSHLMEILDSAMKKGVVVIIDIALMDAKTALWLSSIIIKQVFNKNQNNFIKGGKESLIKATFVVEEAQSVLTEESNVSAFVDLAKEGRKYSLGGIFITQQPSSIPSQILSQGDNFFVFHLLSKGDLDSLQRANAHYSSDVITQLLNEPIKGKCYMWTSSQPFVLPVNISNFESKNQPNKSQEIQARSELLNGIIQEIDQKLSNPVFKKILEKFREIENDGTIERNDKTVYLFRKLDDDEKQFVRREGGLQKNKQNEDFAINRKYYSSLYSF